MKDQLRRTRLTAATAAMVLTVPVAQAGLNVTVLHSFSPTEGYTAAGLLQTADGSLYGTTSMPNGFGLIYKIDAAGNYALLHSFNGSDGGSPDGALMQASDGNLYGTTASGGTGGNGFDGVIYRITPDGSFSIMHDFQGSPDEGEGSRSNLVQAADGALYGTTYLGGNFDNGTVFSMTLSGTYVDQYDFGEDMGIGPGAGLTIAPNGEMLGTTTAGGVFNNGTIFRLGATLHNFGDKDDGANQPVSGVTLGSDGAYYGTTLKGGLHDNGIIYRLAADGSFTVLHEFNAGLSDGWPSGVVEGLDGAFYGTTQNGSKVFRITATGDYSVIYQLGSNANVGTQPNPHAGLILGNDGALYGVTTIGGAQGDGSVFKLGGPISLSIHLSPRQIRVGSSSTIRWATTNATNCMASGAWSGSEPAGGHITVTPTAPGTYRYTLTCSSFSGTKTASAVLRVTP